jgi:hypothetical protein
VSFSAGSRSGFGIIDSGVKKEPTTSLSSQGDGWLRQPSPCYSGIDAYPVSLVVAVDEGNLSRKS